MLARIVAVARMNAWEFVHGKALFMYFCLLAIGVGIGGNGADMASKLLGSCSLGVWVAAILALNSVFDETRQRTLAAVMVRPIARWEYLVGRALALSALFAGFVALCVVIAAGAQLQQFITCAVRGITWIMIVLPLAALLKPWPCTSLLLGAKLLNALVNGVGQYSTVLTALRPFCHYASLTDITFDQSWVWAASVADNLAYAVVVFLACLWGYERQDVRLRES